MSALRRSLFAVSPRHVQAAGAPGLPAAFEPAPRSTAAAASPDDIAAVKQVIEAARKGKEADADAAESASAIRSPASSPNG